MRVVYVHGFAGVSGPMLLGALLDLGVPPAAVQESWQRLHLPAVQVALERVQFTDYTATRPVYAALQVDAFPAPYTYAALNTLIEQSAHPPRAQQRLQQLMEHFAATVARTHGGHERDAAWRSTFLPAVLYMGSGIVTALEALDIEQLLAAPVNVGTAPHPLTAAFLRGATVYGQAGYGEATTVDGAAILTSLAVSYGPLPTMTVLTTGYGASTETAGNDVRGLQVLLGEVEAQPLAERIAVLEANIDDMNPEFYEVVFERLFAAGALDVTLTPLLMKKGRPANTLTVLAPLPAVVCLSRVMLQETSTFGVRVYEVWRQKLERFARQVETCYGMIPIKCGILDGRVVQAAPEYEACKRAARAHGVPIRLVYTEAMRLAASWLT